MTIKKYKTHADWLADRRASTLLGATDAAAFVRKLDFPRSNVAFDAAFAK